MWIIKVVIILSYIAHASAIVINITDIIRSFTEIRYQIFLV